MSNNKRVLIFIYLMFFVLTFYPVEKKLIPLNDLLSIYDFNFTYNENLGLIILKSNNKSASVLLDSPFAVIGNKKIFLYDFIKNENGQFLLPEMAFSVLENYFSGIELYTQKGKSNADEKKNAGFFLETPDLKRAEKSKEQNNKIKPADKVVKIDSETVDPEFIKKQNDVIVQDKYIFDKAPGKLKINAIIIDPGHGGEDPGAVGVTGTKEKDIVLKVSLLLSDILKKEFPGKTVIMTRDRDEFISLDKRAGIANYVFNKYGASLFVSVHVNASRSEKSYGFETWYLVEEYRRDIIKKGNLSDDKDVEKVINSMLNNEIYKESKDLAKKIQERLNKLIGNVSLDRGIKEEKYFVIKKSLMPAVLVEIGFNTNKFEEIRLTRYAYLHNIANGIYYGIKDFIEEYEKTSGFTR